MSFFCSRIFLCSFFALFSFFTFAEKPDHEWTIDELEKLTPKEFQEDEIEKARLANRKASTGKATFRNPRVKVEWSPDGTILTGDPTRLKLEADNLVAVLKKSPSFAKFAAEVKYTEGSKDLNLAPLLKALNREADKKENIHFCHSFSLWYLGKGNERYMSYQELEKNLKATRKLNFSKPVPGDVAVITDQGRANEDVHSFVYVSELISLEKRGLAFNLIRPPNEIEREYQWWTKNMESYTPYPKKQRNLIQYWSQK